MCVFFPYRYYSTWSIEREPDVSTGLADQVGNCALCVSYWHLGVDFICMCVFSFYRCYTWGIVSEQAVVAGLADQVGELYIVCVSFVDVRTVGILLLILCIYMCVCYSLVGVRLGALKHENWPAGLVQDG